MIKINKHNDKENFNIDIQNMTKLEIFELFYIIKNHIKTSNNKLCNFLEIFEKELKKNF